MGILIARNYWGVFEGPITLLVGQVVQYCCCARGPRGPRRHVVKASAKAGVIRRVRIRKGGPRTTAWQLYKGKHLDHKYGCFAEPKYHRRLSEMHQQFKSIPRAEREHYAAWAQNENDARRRALDGRTLPEGANPLLFVDHIHS